ncbi:hypothetical protein DIPPA_33319 [Diplonema papillatum]|nr:hypothetical protein DIPPA_33319 [Diplonema papillatum]
MWLFLVTQLAFTVVGSVSVPLPRSTEDSENLIPVFPSERLNSAQFKAPARAGAELQTCSDNEVLIDGTCQLIILWTFKLRFASISLSDVNGANGTGLSAFEVAVCNDVRTILELDAAEECELESVTEGSVIAAVAIDTIESRATELAVVLEEGLASSSVAFPAVVQVLPSAAIDFSSFSAPAIDGTPLAIAVACTSASCSNRGTATGTRPDCVCTCDSGFEGPTCAFGDDDDDDGFMKWWYWVIVGSVICVCFLLMVIFKCVYDMDKKKKSKTAHDPFESSRTVDSKTLRVRRMSAAPSSARSMGRGKPMQASVLSEPPKLYAVPTDRHSTGSVDVTRALADPIASPRKEVSPVRPVPTGEVSFLDGTGRAVKVSGLDEGRAAYSIDNEARPPFSVVENQGNFLRLPELQRSMILPQSRAQRHAVLTDLRNLFDEFCVKHDIPYDPSQYPTSPFASPPRSYPRDRSENRVLTPLQYVPQSYSSGHYPPVYPPSSAYYSPPPQPPPTVPFSNVYSGVWEQPAMLPAEPLALPPPPISQQNRSPNSISYVHTGRVSPAALGPPDYFQINVDAGMQALAARPDWNPDMPSPRGSRGSPYRRSVSPGDMQLY